jgi:hypothetical protein
MKNEKYIVLGLAGVAVWLILASQRKTNAPTGDAGAAGNFVTEIFDGLGKAFGNGWRYFDNGTAIDPRGNYYQGGQLIWQAPGRGA